METMEVVRIGGRLWKVHITEITESFSILYSENSGRTMSQGAGMVLDPLGTFYNYKITFSREQGKEKEYDELFNFLAIPRYDGLEVNIIHNQALWDKPFMAYVSQGERALKRIDTKTGKVYWDKFSVNIVPMSAQVLPE
jgi:hypothetical protein